MNSFFDNIFVAGLAAIANIIASLYIISFIWISLPQSDSRAESIPIFFAIFLIIMIIVNILLIVNGAYIPSLLVSIFSIPILFLFVLYLYFHSGIKRSLSSAGLSKQKKKKNKRNKNTSHVHTPQ